jgi:hypothetical protein
VKTGSAVSNKFKKKKVDNNNNNNKGAQKCPTNKSKIG